MEWSSTPRGEGETPTPWTPFSERPVSHPPSAVAVLYHLDLSDVAKDQEMLYISIFWVYAVMLKLIPCIVLTVISVWLVRTLCRAKSRRRTLLAQGEVKKAPQTTAPSQSRWRKSDDKVALSIANRSITPPAVQKPKPLDDGGVWMGREEEKVGEATEEEDQKPEEPPSAEEEEVATLVRVDKPLESVRECAPAGSGCWLWRLVKRRRERYSTAEGESSAQQKNTTAVVGAAVRRRRRRTERTTRMLVAVLVLFLVTEFPQGVLGLMSGLFGRCFFRYCYHIFGDLMDLLALLNGSINFILYCAMSRQFRQTFAQLFCKHPRLLWTYFFKSYPAGQNKDIEIMKNGNMGEGHKKVGAATVGQTSQTMGEVQSTYV
ncbi:hypothetical protein J437_LFUL005305 [Ladona fulva]|uniref:G-protein coupled receptors family 1 profile domain-containing protein n=1 Tax=Ladona fulva TaxID=123851 RepID=A0A8K0NYZ0_LADFU|nr:hypothetical protein J437_LFUL005305 [Ladona fulva]